LGLNINKRKSFVSFETFEVFKTSKVYLGGFRVQDLSWINFKAKTGCWFLIFLVRKNLNINQCFAENPD